jgi:hypothetical protein
VITDVVASVTNIRVSFNLYTVECTLTISNTHTKSVHCVWTCNDRYRADYCSSLKPRGSIMYRQASYKIIRSQLIITILTWTAIISLHSPNCLVFLLPSRCFLCGTSWSFLRNNNYPFKAQWSLYVPPVLTFNNSTFCPQSVFMCFVWLWEQTAIISLYNINWLVCITNTECVFCVVRAEVFYVIIITHLKPSGSYMYRQFIIQQFYLLPTVYLRVLCGSENK